MALQLTGAAKLSSIANLQLRLPVVVIGGGLTAIDTATESLAYYVRQVEKFAARYRTLVAERGEAAVRAAWNAEEAGHRRRVPGACRGDRGRARRGGRRAGRRDCAAARCLGRRDDRLSPPADRQPVLHAEPRGSGQGDGGSGPLRRRADAARGRGGRVRPRRRPAPDARRRIGGVLPARAILVAAGTQPNTVLAREDGRIRLDGRYFQAVDEDRRAGQGCAAWPSPTRRMC